MVRVKVDVLPLTAVSVAVGQAPQIVGVALKVLVGVTVGVAVLVEVGEQAPQAVKVAMTVGV